MRTTLPQPISDSKYNNNNIKQLDKTISHQQSRSIQSLQKRFSFPKPKFGEMKGHIKVMQ